MSRSVKRRRRNRSTPPQNRFQKLWNQAERRQRDNEKLRQELDALVQQLHVELGPTEREAAAAAHALILHLLPFLERKSLARWQRRELRAWVLELLEHVIAADLMDDALSEALARDTALQMGIAIDETSELSAEEQVHAVLNEEDEEDVEEMEQVIAREVEEMVRRKFGKSTPRAPVVDLFQTELDEAEQLREEEIARYRQEAEEQVRQRLDAELDELFGSFFDDTAFENDEDGDAETPGLERDILNRLFRRTANALHPDKEPDENRRKERHEQMQRLLDARRQGDILGVYNMHREHVGTDTTISPEDETELLAALQAQIARLDRERLAIINETPIHTEAFQEFYGCSRKVRNRKIGEIRRQAEQQTRDYLRVIEQVRTLVALKPILEERSWSDYDVFTIGDEDDEFF